MRTTSKRRRPGNIEYWLMIAIPALFVLVFAYGSMAGIFLAFQDFLPGQGFYVFGSEFVGFDNFSRIFQDRLVWNVFRNTVVIAGLKIVFGTVIPILIAVVFNEINNLIFKKSVQTIIFLPHFISWVIISGVMLSMFDVSGGALVRAAQSIGIKLPDFFRNTFWFPVMLVGSALWKDAGYSAVIFIAAITTIDQALYEAATIDGAGYTRRCRHVTLPGMMPIIILMTVLSLGNILNADFEQVFNMYNVEVYATGDILDTFMYRRAFSGATDYGFSTAVGLLKSVVAFIMIGFSYLIADKAFGYKIV